MMMKFSHTIETTASREKIWNIWTTPSTWRKWDYELEYVKLDKFKVGAVGKMKSRRAKEFTFILEKAGKYDMTIAVKLPLATLHINRRVLPKKDGCRFMHETSFEGPMGAAYGIIFGRRFRRELPLVMKRVKKLAESTSTRHRTSRRDYNASRRNRSR